MVCGRENTVQEVLGGIEAGAKMFYTRITA